MATEFDISTVLYQSQRTRVLKAHRRLDNLAVILKVSEDLNASKSIRTLNEEFKISQFIDSPYVRQVLGIETLNHRPTLVLVDPQLDCLSDKIPDKGMSTNDFFNVAIELARAIRDVHDHGVIHRDINPSNVLVDAPFTCLQLIDFEHAARLEERQLDFEPVSQLKGTLAYIAPEQTGRINKAIDYRADIYGLGATLFELATGRTLFTETEPAKLIYAHIAVTPEMIGIRRPDLPEALGIVISKLLEKEPNNRYQSCEILISDLTRIRKAYWDNKPLENFQPDTQGKDLQCLMSTKVFGRKAQKKELLECFQLSQIEGQFITIAGPEGIGKTALISELYKEISAQNGFFLKGKFDQYSKGLSHTAFISAFDDLINQCLDDSSIDWRAVFDAALGSDAAFVCGIAPNFQQFTSYHERVDTLDAVELITRVNGALVTVFSTLSRLGKQIVLFIDDLQWTDSASTNLIFGLVSAKIPRLMLIASFRNKEINDNAEALRMLRQAESLTKKINLSPLLQGDVEAWVLDIIGEQQNNIDLISQQVYLRTKGNPFYTQSLLRHIAEKNILSFDDAENLVVDVEMLRSLPTGDVYEHLADEIGALNQPEKDFLKTISVLGNSFSLDAIELLIDAEINAFQDILKSLVEKKLLTKIHDELCFFHDTIQHVSANLLSESDRINLHLNYGLKLRLQQTGDGKAATQPEAYIHHLNIAKSSITDSNLKILLAQENYSCALKLFSSGAYKAATDVLEMGLFYLEGFVDQPALHCGIYTKLGEANLILGMTESGEKYLAKARTLAQSSSEKAIIYQCLLLHYISSNQSGLLLAALLDLSKLIDLKLPIKPHHIKRVLLFNKLKLHKLSAHPEKLHLIPSEKTAEADSQDACMSACLLGSYFATPEHYPFIVLRGVERIFKYGLTKSSSQVLIGYAVLLLTNEEYELSYRYGELAVSLLGKLDSKMKSAYVNFTYGALIQCWRASFKSSEAYFTQSIKEAEDAGDMNTVTIATTMLAGRRFYGGTNLQRLIETQKDDLVKLTELDKQASIDYCNYNTQLFQTLVSTESDGHTIVGEYADENLLLSRWLVDGYAMSRGNYYLDKTIVCCFAREYKMAIDNFVLAVPPLKTRYGSLFLPFARFYAAISYIQLARLGSSKENLRKAKQQITYIKNLAVKTPLNYRGKYKLLQAEVYSFEGKHLKAMCCYEEAICYFDETKFVQDEALACELFGRYLFTANLKNLAMQRLVDSVECYRRWGALYRVKKLSDEFSLSAYQQPNKPGAQSTTNTTISSELDLQVLAKSIQLLSSSLEAEALLSELLKAVTENSGATRAHYVMVEGGNLSLAASYIDGVTQVYLSKNPPGWQDQSIDEQLLISCLEKDEGPKLTNIYLDVNGRLPNFPGTDFIDYERDENSSVLTVPCIRHNLVSGIIYLENKLLADAFREDKFQVLSLLANQASIALENAKAFSVLNIERNFSASIISRTPIMVFGISMEGIIEFANPQATLTTGYSETELLGRDWWEIFASDLDQKTRKERFFNIVKNPTSNVEQTVIIKNGEARQIVWNSFAKRGESRKLSQVITFGSDITVQKNALSKISNFNTELQEIVTQKTQSLNKTIENLEATKNKLVESEKLAALGGLVSGVAHEINTPIGVGVTGVTQLINDTQKISDQYMLGSMTQKSLEAYFSKNAQLTSMIYKGLTKTADLVSSFKQISVDQSSEKKRKFALLACIKNILNSMSDKYDSDLIKIVLTETKDFVIESHPDLYAKIFTNLVMNSLIHAFDEGESGEITIEVEEQRESINILYYDNGKGINSAHLSKIFDPFYTTNNVGGGLGLGLNVVYNVIVKNLGGSINCSSVEGKGASFNIIIPDMSENELIEESQF